MTQTTDTNLSGKNYHDLQTCWPCLTGEDIARRQEFQTLHGELKALISAPASLYATLYETTLLNFMEFCQAMPYNMHQPKPYSLLATALETAVAALKVRRGVMMPQHSHSETIAEQEPLWTYAVFIASLWVRLPDLQTDRSIELYKNEQEKIGLWHPISGNLYEPHTFYKVLAKPHPMLIDRTACLSANLIKIMPSVACRWLSSDQKVWSACWEVMTHTASTHNELRELIQKILPHSETIAPPTEKITIINSSETEPEKNKIEKVEGSNEQEECQENKDQEVTQSKAPFEAAIPEEDEPFVENTASEPKLEPPASEKLNQTHKSQAVNALADLNQWIMHHCSPAGGLNGKKQFLRIQSGLLIRDSSLTHFIKENSEYESVESLLKLLIPYLRKEENQVIFHYCFVHNSVEKTLHGIILRRRYLCEPLKNFPDNQFIQNLS